MHIACSTLCFATQPLEEALRQIALLEFSQVEIALFENWAHLNPSEVERDLAGVLRRVRGGPGLDAVALNVGIDAADPEQYRQQLRAVCRLAKMLTVTCITIPAGDVAAGFDAEVARLTDLCRCTHAEGITLCVENQVGGLAEDPATAVELCKAVPGLALTLDPSYYIFGPNQNRDFTAVYPHVQHVHLRDSGTGLDQVQVPVGQGLVDYSRILLQLQRYDFDRTLSVQFIDQPDSSIDMETEVRKLKLVLESLI